MRDTITVLHPGVEASTHAGRAAPQASAGALPTSLRGLRVAMLDNTKINADNLFMAIARRLEKLGAEPARMFRKRHAGESGAAQIPGVLAWRPDVVLTGLGD